MTASIFYFSRLQHSRFSSWFFALDFYDNREIDTLSASMTRHAPCLPTRLKWHVVNQQVLSTPPATIYFAQRCYGQINWIVVIRNLGHKADKASSPHDNFSNNNAVKCFCGKHFRSIIGLMLFEVFVFVVILCSTVLEYFYTNYVHMETWGLTFAASGEVSTYWGISENRRARWP